MCDTPPDARHKCRGRERQPCDKTEPDSGGAEPGGVPSLLSRSPSLPDSDADGLGKTQRNHECRGCAGDRDLMSGERSRPQPAHH